MCRARRKEPPSVCLRGGGRVSSGNGSCAFLLRAFSFAHQKKMLKNNDEFYIQFAVANCVRPKKHQTSYGRFTNRPPKVIAPKPTIPNAAKKFLKSIKTFNFLYHSAPRTAADFYLHTVFPHFSISLPQSRNAPLSVLQTVEKLSEPSKHDIVHKRVFL